MRTRTLCAIMSMALAAAACGGGDGSSAEVEEDEPMLRVESEGGFAPVEMVLANGPRYTLLGDGSLIFQGVQTMEYPGRLVPPYMVGMLSDEQFAEVIGLVEEIGLADLENETDDSAMNMVADATTEVVTLWDVEGEHRLAVYALGIEESPSGRNQAFLDLNALLDGFAAGLTAEPYEAERVRLVAGPGTSQPEFEDLREWPLESPDLSSWEELANGWLCMVVDGPVPRVFDDATQATTWDHPEEGEMRILVRPLHPGEPDCPS